MIKKILPFVSLLFMIGCSSSDSWNFKTDYFKIKVNKQGYITSMKNTTVSPVHEFSPANKPSPLLSLYDSEKKVYFEPDSAGYDKKLNEITLGYPNGSVAKVSIEPQEKYIKFTLKSLEPRNTIDAVQWGSYYTTINNLIGEIIGVARDTSAAVNYSIGMLSLNDNTIGGTADIEGDASPFQYVIHTPDAKRFPLPSDLHEGQVFTLGGDGISDVAFYAHKEPYYRITYGNAAQVDKDGQIFLNYQSRDRSKPREVLFSLMPNMPANIPNHINVEPIEGVDFIGSSIALWGSPDDIALMDVIQNIVLSEGLPYPTVNGKWVKDPAAYMPDLANQGSNCDSLVSYASQLGFKGIHITGSALKVDRGNEGYIDGTDYSKKPYHFTDGNKSHKEVGEMAKKANVLLGRANITISLPPGTKDASPIPSDSLCYQQKRLLTKNINAKDTLIYIDDPKYLNEVASWEGHFETLNIIKIGKELIHYMGVTDTAPYRLKNVKRGYWGTTAADHQANDTIYKLQVTVCYGYDGLIPNIALQDEIAKYYADVCRLNNVGMLDFDGMEFLFNNGHGYYSVKRFFRILFDKAKEYGLENIRFTGATLSEGSWHYQSVWNVGGGQNMYDAKTREWGSTTSQGKDLRDVTYSNYFPISYGANFGIGENSTVEEFEHIQAVSIGYGVTYYLRINQDEVEKCTKKQEIFNVIRTWENARAANAFPREIKYMLRDPQYDWKLEALDKDKWMLHRMKDGAKFESYKLKRSEKY